MEKSPYQIIKHRLVTEKAKVLENLKQASSNASVRACESPKYVFIVDRKANKQEIAWALEKIYADKKITVTKVNTSLRKPKPRRVRGFLGKTSFQKKAIITLKPGDELDEQV